MSRAEGEDGGGDSGGGRGEGAEEMEREGDGGQGRGRGGRTAVAREGRMVEAKWVGQTRKTKRRRRRGGWVREKER